MRISDWSSDVCSSDLTTCGVVNELRSKRQDKMNGPTLFLSSTVFDFADLRSALKDYLELRGCRVLASERSEEHTSELQSLMRISYAVFCLKKKKDNHQCVTTLRYYKH